MKRSAVALPILGVAVLVVVAVGVLVARTAGPAAAPAPTAQLRVAVPTLGSATKTTDCQYRVGPNGAMLPDQACTPGAPNPELTRDVLCAAGFTTRRYRRVTEGQKRSAFGRYGVATHAAGQYEVDHLIALEDGGANDNANLWPQPASPAPGFHEKDLVEAYIHRQVCAGAMALAEGQQSIASDWTMLLEVAKGANVVPKQHDENGDESD